MYNRLFTKILDSSIWLESSNTRIVWITLLAAMDETGYAHFSAVENLANRARVSVEDTNKALECLLAPDPNSANPDNEGRRIERVPGGFMILNADTHRKTLNREIRREQTRLRVAKFRALQNGNSEIVTPALRGVTSASESESASVQGKRVQRERGFEKPTSSQLVEILGSVEMANDFLDYYESNGWKVGRNKMVDWKSSARRWKRTNGTNKKHNTVNPRTVGTALEGSSAQFKGFGKV